jgi:hypothetical protein
MARLPGEDAHEQDGKLLSMAALHAEREEQGEGITSLFVRGSVYFAFFGKPEDGGADGGSPVSRPPHTRARYAEFSSPQDIAMGSAVNASVAICEAGTGSKRAAGEATPAGQSSGKRQRISCEEPSMPTQQSLSTFAENRLSVIWNDLQEREFEEAEVETVFATQGASACVDGRPILVPIG